MSTFLISPCLCSSLATFRISTFTSMFVTRSPTLFLTSFCPTNFLPACAATLRKIQGSPEQSQSHAASLWP